MNSLSPSFKAAPTFKAALLLGAWLLYAAPGQSLAQAVTTPTLPAQTAPPPAAGPAPGPAAPLPASATLSFAQVQTALRSSPGWRSAEERYKAAQLSLDAARARAGLNLTAGGSLGLGKTPADTGDVQTSTTLTGQVSATVLPYGSALDPVGSAERALSRAAAELQNTRQTLLLSALQDYLAARNAARQETLSTAQAALAARQLDVAQAQRDNGVLSVEDLLIRQQNLQNAQASAIDAQAAREISERQLLSDLGLEVNTARLNLPSTPTLPDAPAPLSDLLARADQQRSEITQAASQLDDARAALISAQRQRLPSLSASLNYGELTSSTGLAGRTVSGSLDFKTGVAAASFNLPLTSSAVPIPTSLALGLSGSVSVLGRAENAGIASAVSSVRSAELALQSTRSSVELDVRRKYNAAQSSRRLLEVQQTAVSRAQTTLESVKARLGAGLDTQLGVQVAEVGVQSAQAAYDQALANAYLAAAQLDQAASHLDPALILAGATQ